MSNWKQIRDRFFTGQDSPNGFYGCVDKEGNWFDSALSFEIALHWCAMHAGQYDLSPMEEIAWLRDEGIKLGFSIIHSSTLERMADKGLLK